MKIGIFTKCGHVGGSELRCAELANGIARHTPHQAFLLCEGIIHPKVLKTVDRAVAVRPNVVRIQEKVPILYEMDVLLVVNTDSEEFTNIAYWQGKTYRHGCTIDLSRMTRLVFLFNFIVEPAAHLPSLFPYVPDIRIITANLLFFHSISTQDKYQAIRHLPRLVLASPIDPNSVSTYKNPSERIRIGQYSMPHIHKFNEDIGTLVARINAKYGDRVSWHFMGMPTYVAGRIAPHPNVTTREAFAVSVKSFLEETDIFLFYPTWDRSEPWARSIAEALMSGCPVVATAKGGNCDQIIPGNNGYLCRSLEDFVECLKAMIEQPELIRLLGTNAVLYSRYFNTAYVIGKFMEFIR